MSRYGAGCCNLYRSLSLARIRSATSSTTIEPVIWPKKVTIKRLFLDSMEVYKPYAN